MHAQQIMLVDDLERFLFTLARLLKKRGFEVSTATSGRQALEKLATGPEVSVVVLDMRMPGLDGLETLQRIKREYPACEVIMLTGQATLEEGVEALRRGAFDYIQKPCDIDELEAKIRSASSLEQIKRHPVLWLRCEAGEVMLSGFVPLLPQDSLQRALEIFNRYQHGAGAQMLFVVDEHRCLQGSISRSDVVDAARPFAPAEDIDWDWICGHGENLPQTTVAQIMNRHAASVQHSTTLTETARLMLQYRYDSMPVTAYGIVLGIVRLRDVLQYLRIAQESDMAL